MQHRSVEEGLLAVEELEQEVGVFPQFHGGELAGGDVGNLVDELGLEGGIDIVGKTHPEQFQRPDVVEVNRIGDLGTVTLVVGVERQVGKPQGQLVSQVEQTPLDGTVALTAPGPGFTGLAPERQSAQASHQRQHPPCRPVPACASAHAVLPPRLPGDGLFLGKGVVAEGQTEV